MLEFAPEELSADFEVVFNAVKNFSACYSSSDIPLQFASLKLRDDSTIVTTAIARCNSSFKFASERLKLSRSFVETAIAIDPMVLEYVDSVFKNNKEIVLLATSFKYRYLMDNIPFEFASDSLKKNREFVLQIVKIDGEALQFADETFKNDKEIALAAIAENKNAFDFISKQLQRDKDILEAYNNAHK